MWVRVRESVCECSMISHGNIAFDALRYLFKVDDNIEGTVSSVKVGGRYIFVCVWVYV